MCGIFGVLNSFNEWSKRDFATLARHAQQRGADSSGLLFFDGTRYRVNRAHYKILTLLKDTDLSSAQLVFGHSRLVTSGQSDNQPVVRESIIVLHNGIVVNHEDLWDSLKRQPELSVDSEVIAAIVADHLDQNGELSTVPDQIMNLCKGVVACAVVIPHLGKALLFSNNGSLYVGTKGNSQAFSSEEYPLTQVGCTNVRQLKGSLIVDIPIAVAKTAIRDIGTSKSMLVPPLLSIPAEESLLDFHDTDLKRCSKCILPETMPFIEFDSDGICNYCHNYVLRNVPRQKEELEKLVEPYRRTAGNDCIVPFSGGRDSSYALHLVVNELKMQPVTYTYDWGMVTDLGRRNISRMSAQLGVENIIVAADIRKKRQHISKNLTAWLRSPELGMISILTAGDKHFFRHIERVKLQTRIDLNLWGVNPLEVTHFKSGFLGIPPDFAEKNVYSSGAIKQLRYQTLRLNAMRKSPGYFNSSLWDTLSGEYWRSFAGKTDYFHIFDYWRWDEGAIDSTLDVYDWERAPDTNTTWRIGDGTAAFYNYVYFTVAGFTEHDTFRSNQIREGDISREEALFLVRDENRPRFPNIKWYLNALGMDFEAVITTINSIPKVKVQQVK
jgi:glucosamine--fructose-6-phosphate aminotransferase (isomerizing)